MTMRRGGCACGAVRFEADVPRETYSACHCGTCRRMVGGSPFFGVRTTQVTFEGESDIARYASSGWAVSSCWAKSFSAGVGDAALALALGFGAGWQTR